MFSFWPQRWRYRTKDQLEPIMGFANHHTLILKKTNKQIWDLNSSYTLRFSKKITITRLKFFFQTRKEDSRGEGGATQSSSEYRASSATVPATWDYVPSHVAITTPVTPIQELLRYVLAHWLPYKIYLNRADCRALESNGRLRSSMHPRLPQPICPRITDPSSFIGPKLSNTSVTPNKWYCYERSTPHAQYGQASIRNCSTNISMYISILNISRISKKRSVLPLEECFIKYRKIREDSTKY